MQDLLQEVEQLRARLTSERWANRDLQDKLDDSVRMIDRLGAAAQGYEVQWQTAEKAREHAVARAESAEAEAMEVSGRLSAASRETQEWKESHAREAELLRDCKKQLAGAERRCHASRVVNDALAKESRRLKAENTSLGREVDAAKAVRPPLPAGALEWIAKHAPEVLRDSYWEDVSGSPQEVRSDMVREAQEGWAGGPKGMVARLWKQNYGRTAKILESKLTGRKLPS